MSLPPPSWTMSLLLLSAGGAPEAVARAIGAVLPVGYQGEPTDLVRAAPSPLASELPFEEVEPLLDDLADALGWPSMRAQPPRFAVAQVGTSPSTVDPALASRHTAPVEALWCLSFHPAREVRVEVAKNPSTPLVLLRWLAREFPWEVAGNPGLALWRLADPALDHFFSWRIAAPPPPPGTRLAVAFGAWRRP